MSSRQRTSIFSSVTTILRGIDSDIRAMSATMNEVNQAER